MKNIKTTKIVICSLSCAGKTTLIKRLQDVCDIEAVEGAKTLQKIANVSKEAFKDLDRDSKQKARARFLDYLKNLKTPKTLVVDGHYSFWRENGDFEIAMSDEDFRTYDAVLFLDIDTEELQKRILQRDKKHIERESLRCWYEFELLGLQQQCQKHNTFFSVINDDVYFLARFIESLATKDPYLLPHKVFERFYTQYHKTLQKHKKIFLVDCDGTLTKQDSVKEFYKHKEVSHYIIPNAFCNHRFYGFYQFFCLTQRRLEIEESLFLSICQKVYHHIALYPKFVRFLCEQEATIVAITAGIRPIYHLLFAQHNIPFLLVSNDRQSIVSQETKAYFAKALRELGYEVLAIGNGIVDIPMLLNAERGFLVDSPDRERIDAWLRLDRDRQEQFANIEIINANTAITLER